MNNLFKNELSEDVIRIIEKYGKNSIGMVAWNQDGSDLVEITEQLYFSYINNILNYQQQNDANKVTQNLRKPVENPEKEQVKNTINFLKTPLNNEIRAQHINFLYKKLASNLISQELNKEFPNITREDLLNEIEVLDNILVRVEYQLSSLSVDDAKIYFEDIISSIQNIASMYNEDISSIFDNDVTKQLSQALYGNEYDLSNLLEQLDIKSKELVRSASYIDEVNYDLDDFEQYKLFLEDCKRSLCQEKFMRLWHHISEKTSSKDINEIAYIVGRELDIPTENIVELYSSMR